MLTLRSRIEKAIRSVSHPATGANLFDAGIVQSLSMDDGKVVVVLAVDAAEAREMEAVREQCQSAVSGVRGVASARVILTAQRAKGAPSPTPPPPPLPAPRPHARPAPPTPEPIRGVSHVIAIASGKGGVGKSTTSVNLAFALCGLGVKVGLVDCDIYGPSIAHMLGLTGRPQIDADKRIRPAFHAGVATMSMGLLMNVEEAAVWRGPMVIKATQQLLTEVAWDEAGPIDVLVIDLPPGTGDVQLTMVQTVHLSGAVIVSTPQDLALIDARKAHNMFQKVGAPVLGVIENMSHFTCPHCGERSDLFGHGGARAAAAEAGLPFLGEIPLHMAIREAGDGGRPLALSAPGSPQAQAYEAIARRLAAAVGLTLAGD